MKGYKAMDKNMTCNGFQFEVGKTYKHTGEVKLCEQGFHFCENPLEIINFYSLVDSTFFEIEAEDISKEKEEDSSKRVCKKITITSQLSLSEWIQACFDFLSKNVSVSDGHSAKLASSGDSTQLVSSGDFAKLVSSGNCAQLASSGYCAKLASSGAYAQLASSGYYAKLASSGDYSIIAAIGKDNIAKGVKGNWLVLAEWKDDKPRHVISRKVDGKKIKENTWYTLKNKKLVEVML